MDIHPDFEYSIHGDLLLYAVIPVTIGFSSIPKYTGKSTLLQMWGHFILSVQNRFRTGFDSVTQLEENRKEGSDF
jgi:hypothetical protein